jgi:hypothetical protein
MTNIRGSGRIAGRESKTSAREALGSLGRIELLMGENEEIAHLAAEFSESDLTEVGQSEEIEESEEKCGPPCTRRRKWTISTHPQHFVKSPLPQSVV